MSPRAASPRTVVVGGGLAGIAAALRLADHGERVTLVERAPHLGGLCRSVADPYAGRVDTGQHVFLGCCAALERLLVRLAAAPAVRQRRLELVMAGPAAPRTLRALPLPSPLHLAGALARWPGLSPADRAGAAALGQRVARFDDEELAALDGVPCLGWLQAEGQSAASCTWLWEPILVASCNVTLARGSAGLAAFVIRDGLMAGPTASALRVPRTDLTRWLDPPARASLAAARVALQLRWRATALRAGGPSGLAVAGETPTGAAEAIPAEAVVLAVPARAARRLLPPPLAAAPELAAAAALDDSPIVNAHLFCDRPILPGPIVVAPDSPLQWCFDRTALGEPAPAGARPAAYHVAISLSAAEAEVARPADELAATLWEACRRLFPAARRARLLHHRVTREAHATFAAVPGSLRARPGPATGNPAVVLAGSWTATGWPATMEGAVRSGEAAARQVLAGRITKGT